MSHIITKEQFENGFACHVKGYVEFMYESLSSFNTCLASLDVILESKAKSNLFHAIAIKKAKDYFEGKDGIRIISRHQTIQIVINGTSVGKIKKVNKDKLSANIKTKHISQIWANQYSLFDLQPITCIELAHRMDKSCTEFEYLGVVCRKEKNILWDINYRDINDIGIVIPTPPVVPTIKPDIAIKIRQA